MYRTRVGARANEMSEQILYRFTGWFARITIFIVHLTSENTHTNNIKDEKNSMVDKVTPLNGMEELKYGADGPLQTRIEKEFLPLITSILGENQQGDNDAHNQALPRISI
ncbi:hypothetical protein EAE96_002088 [Botrytis aclada]|nr:hypothetical protein EAE96_002088 [Botrytis aclada]